MDNVSALRPHATVPIVPSGLPEAVLWDMDGTIIDTEPQWLAAEITLAESYGGTWNERLGEELIGMALPESILIFRQLAGIDAPADRLITELIDEMVRLVRSGEAGWRPGAQELLATLNRQGIPSALVTMSYQELADVVIEMLPAGTFQEVVTGDQVTNGKPHPEPYLLAAHRLGAEVTRTVALEDSIPGVTSAAASGAWTIGVPAHQDIPRSAEYAVIPTLAGVRPADLFTLAARRGHE